MCNHEKYYPDEPVNIHIQLLINIIQDTNWVITTKKGKGKLQLFCGNLDLVITIYGEEGSANKLAIIPTSRQKSSGVTSEPQDENKERGEVLSVRHIHPPKEVHRSDIRQIIGLIRPGRFIWGSR